jgi:hypothetical protein
MDVTFGTPQVEGIHCHCGSLLNLETPLSLGNGEWTGSSRVYDSAIRLQYGIHVSLTEY